MILNFIINASNYNNYLTINATDWIQLHSRKQRAQNAIIIKRLRHNILPANILMKLILKINKAVITHFIEGHVS